jgi:hypothetical protein
MPAFGVIDCHSYAHSCTHAQVVYDLRINLLQRLFSQVVCRAFQIKVRC